MANDTELELGDLTVDLARGEALAQELDAVHLGFGAASAVIAARSSPDGSPDAFRNAQDVMAGVGSGGVGVPGSCVLMRRNDRRSTSGGDGVMAFTGVEGTVDCEAGDLLVGWDLGQQLGQHGRVTDVAGGELGGPDVPSSSGKQSTGAVPDPPPSRCGSCAESHAAPPVRAAWRTRRFVPPCLRAFRSSAKQSTGLFFDPPHPSPLALIPVLSIIRCSGPSRPRSGMLTFRGFWRRDSVLKSGTFQSRPIRREPGSRRRAAAAQAVTAGNQSRGV